MPDFEKLAVWRKAHQLALRTYALTEELPGSERYALRDQMRRAAVAVPSNIAEGVGRATERELAYFLRVALGSLSELQALMLLARDLEYVEAAELPEFFSACAELTRMLRSFHQRTCAAAE